MKKTTKKQKREFGKYHHRNLSQKEKEKKRENGKNHFRNFLDDKEKLKE